MQSCISNMKSKSFSQLSLPRQLCCNRNIFKQTKNYSTFLLLKKKILPGENLSGKLLHSFQRMCKWVTEDFNLLVQRERNLSSTMYHLL